jgi:hypothetical protein
MKNIKLAVVLSAVMLSVASLAQADTTNKLNHHFMSKRAYHAPVENSQKITADAPWEGATYRPAEANDEDALSAKGAQSLKQLNLHSLAKRSYM